MDRKILEKILLDFLNVRSVITLGAFGLSFYILAHDKALPEFLSSFVFMLQGFWFGSKLAGKPEEKEIKP